MRTSGSEILIIGAGPVGLATAVHCARRGLSVRVLDRAAPPIDKACGEGIMPDGVARLRALGVDPLSAGGTVLRGIRYIDGELAAEARFKRRPGVGIRRTRLQPALVAAASAAGVRIDFGVTARGLSSPSDARCAVQTDHGSIEADFVVGADGLASRTRRWSGLDAGSRGSRFGVRRHYRMEPWTDLVEVHWSDRCEAYVTPLGGGEVGVALLWSGPKGRFDDLLHRFPALVERLDGAEVASQDRGVGPLERRVEAVTSGRRALVGDAAGYVDAITGEGLTAGLAQAEVLAAALESGALNEYRRDYRRIQRLPTLLIRVLLAIERRPPLRRRFVEMLARDQELFERLLEVHVGDRRPTRLGWSAVVGMGRLLRAGRF